MQEYQKRILLSEDGEQTVTIFTIDGENRQGLGNFSVIHYPGAPCLGLQRGGSKSKPYLVATIEEIRLLHEATGEILRRLDGNPKTE